MWCGQDVGCGHGGVRGRGRRPRRPARPWTSPWAFPCTRRAEDVAPNHVVRGRTWGVDMGVCVVGADVPAARASVDVPVGVSVCAARRGRRALPCVADRTWGVDMGVCVVGADVPGGPRACGRPRWCPRVRGAPRTSRPTMWCGQGVGCGHGCVRGRGRRPRRPACLWASTMASPCARRGAFACQTVRSCRLDVYTWARNFRYRPLP